MKAEEIKIALDDLVHDSKNVEIAVNNAISFIESQQKEIEELKDEKIALIGSSNQLIIENVRLEGRNKELKEGVEKIKETYSLDNATEIAIELLTK